MYESCTPGLAGNKVVVREVWTLAHSTYTLWGRERRWVIGENAEPEPIHRRSRTDVTDTAILPRNFFGGWECAEPDTCTLPQTDCS